MNKQQIIVPLVAMLIVGAIIGIPSALVIARKNHHFYVRARSEEIGRSLIKATNSLFLTEVSSDLSIRLSVFLDSPTHIQNITVEDASAPDGDGKAISQIWLANERHEEIVIRLRQENKPDKFSVIGFWSPPTTPANAR